MNQQILLRERSQRKHWNENTLTAIRPLWRTTQLYVHTIGLLPAAHLLWPTFICCGPKQVGALLAPVSSQDWLCRLNLWGWHSFSK